MVAPVAVDMQVAAREALAGEAEPAHQRDRGRVGGLDVGLDPVQECEVNIRTVKRMLDVVDRLDRDNRLGGAIERQDAVSAQAILQEAMLAPGA